MATEWNASSKLRAYYLAEFRPSAVKKYSYKRLQQYDSALRRFEKFVGGGPRLGAVTHELLTEFKNVLRSRRCSVKLSANLSGCIRMIVRHWTGEIIPRVETLPPAEPGSLRYYFEQTYRPEAMLQAKPTSVADHMRAIRALRKYAGHEVQLAELSDGMLAGFLQSLLANGTSAASANRYRAVLLAVWNHAFTNRIVDRAPRVKKLKEVHNPPEAWTVADLRKLLAAARRFRPGDSHGPIPCNRFWTALLHVAYDTALRRGTLFAIRQEDVDLAGGLLRIDGSASKTLKGQTFRLSADTVAALAEIWDPPRELVFGGLHRRQQYRDFGLLIEAAGIRPHRRKGLNKFHAMRRTTATLVAAASGVGAASSLLGHSDSYVTRRYCDPTALEHDVTKILPSLLAG